MIHRYKGSFFSDADSADIRKGDLVLVDGTVGELISDYDPDYLELIVEGGVSHSVSGFTEVRKLKRLSSKRSMPVPAYSY
jgi:Na+-transporting NADH:ubiquinone oxidoreductase subunit NqrF